jgi:hypothetical protein
MIEKRAQGIDVAARADRFGFAGGLFGGDVAWRPEHLSGDGNIRLVEKPFRQPEIGDARFACVINQDVRGFEIAMEHSAVVRVLNRERNSVQAGCSARGWKRFFASEVSQILALDIFHRKKWLTILVTDLENGNDIRMPQRGNGLSFSLKALIEFIRGERPSQEEFDGREAMEFNMAGFVDDSHTAVRDFFEDFVITETARSPLRKRDKAARVWKIDLTAIVLFFRTMQPQAQEACRTGVATFPFGQAIPALTAFSLFGHALHAYKPEKDASLQPCLGVSADDLNQIFDFPVDFVRRCDGVGDFGPEILAEALA